MGQTTCPTCGMPRSDWLASDGQGYAAGDQLHCCRGCAEGAGCTCRQANPGDASWDERIEADAAALMSPRDRNGRPVGDTGPARQLLETAGSGQPPRTGAEANRAVESRPQTPDSAPGVHNR